MLQKIKLSYKTIAVASTFLLVGCGGGGASSGVSLPSKPDSSKMAKIDNDNAKQSSLLAYRTINLLSSNKLLKIDDIAFAYSSDKNAKKVSRSNRVIKQSCDSGSIKADINEADKTAIIYYNNCLNNGATYNGKATYYYYNEDQYELDFENTTIKSGEVNMDIKKANIYYIGDEPYEMTKVYMSMEAQGKKIEYFNFNYYLNGEEDGVKFNGYVKPFCLDGYLYAETKGRIKFADKFNSLDPIGLFIVKSNKEVKVDLDGDLIYLTLPNKTEEVYKTSDIASALNSQACSISIKQTLPTRPKRDAFIKLNRNANRDVKTVSATFNSVNFDVNQKLPFIENIYNDIDSGLSCISGSVDEKDNGNKIDAQYNNCKVTDNVIYDGNISFELDGSNVSKMDINNLTIKYNGNDSTITKATIRQGYDGDYFDGTVFHINNLYAKIDRNEYLNYTIEHAVNDSKNIHFSGYIKPNCIDGYLYLYYRSSINYDTDGNLDNFSLGITDRPQQNIKDDEVDVVVLNADMDSYDYNVNISFPGETEVIIPLDEFLDKCK